MTAAHGAAESRSRSWRDQAPNSPAGIRSAIIQTAPDTSSEWRRRNPDRPTVGFSFQGVSPMKTPSRTVVSLRRAAKDAALFLAGAMALISLGAMRGQAAAPDSQVGSCVPGKSAVAADNTAPAGGGARLGMIVCDNGSAGGVKVLRVYAGGPAEKMGLRSGDVITAADSKSLSNTGELQAIVFNHRPGDFVSLSVTRSDWRRDFLALAVSQADLARLPDFQAVNKAATRAISPVAPAVRPSFFTIELPSEWELIRDPYLRARYTRFR